MPRSIDRPGRLILLSIALFFAGSVRSRGGDGIHYPGYFPSFPAPAPAMGVGAGGAPGVWLGGDAGFLCPLDFEKSFWSFADVAIGPVGALTRKDSTNHKKSLAVGNSVAIATCQDGHFSVQHYFRGSPDEPLPFFADPNNPLDQPHGSRLWLRKATLHDDRLYIFAHSIANPGNVYNTYIIRVANPHDPPTHWAFDYLSVGIFANPTIGKTTAPAPVHFGNEAVLDVPTNWLYTYGVYATNAPHSGGYAAKFHVTAMRIPLDQLETKAAWGDLGPHCQFMTKTPGRWKPGLHDPTDYYDVGIPAFNGFSVRANSTLKAWQVVFCDDYAHQQYFAGKRPASDPEVNGVFAMAGRTLYGPWGARARVAEIPEMDPSRAGAAVHAYNPDDYGYFIGEKSAFETSDRQVVFSYSVGSYANVHGHDGVPILTDMKEYTVDAWSAANPLFPAPKPAVVKALGLGSAPPKRPR